MDWNWILPVVLAAVGLGVLVLGITGLCILLQGMASPKESCSCILVLGSKLKDGCPTQTMDERIARAYAYLKEHPAATAVLSGGSGAGERLSEARYMLETLTAMGIGEGRLLMEDKATSTWTNLRYSMALLEQRTGTRPGVLGVVTSDYHLFRAMLHGRRQKISLVGIPAKTKNFTRWLPGFLREIAGVWHYIILGGTYD